jgi:hypothetical protein
MVCAIAALFMRNDMYAEIDAKSNKQYSRDISHPFLYSMQTLGEGG